MSTSQDAAVQATPAQSRRFFGHPSGLSTLFFTEMWERFSYYGMRPHPDALHDEAFAEGGLGYRREIRQRHLRSTEFMLPVWYLASCLEVGLQIEYWALRRAIMLGAIMIACGHISHRLINFRTKLTFFAGSHFDCPAAPDC